ncbi:MAG: type II toxin-antitoxin system PemK/MazF family toxin [Patescibacteria group bacterium]|nr:type II toxin-antitoxin system PemK/MazF family toxin [Patescibacteria group bacterium]
MNEEYFKDFENRSKLSGKIQDRDAGLVLTTRGAVWLVRFGVNIGSEMDGKGPDFLRPVVVIKRINFNMFLCAPVSSNVTEDRYRIPFKLNGDDRVAVLSQIKTLDKKRCVKLMATLPEEDMRKIIDSIGSLYVDAETPQPSKTDGENLDCPLVPL